MMITDAYAMTPVGDVMIASGMDPVKLWNGFRPAPVDAGILPPDTACVLAGGVTPGDIFGNYAAYVRFIKDDGSISNLSPLSPRQDIRGGSGGNVTNATNTDPIEITTDAPHGLTSGDVVDIESVEGTTAANGTWEVTVTGASTFQLDTSSGDGAYTTGGTWEPGSSSVEYSSVPVPTSPLVARRQIVRNLDGEFTVFYVDIDTDDLVSTTFTSFKSDNELGTQTAVPLLSTDGAILAMAHDPPPDFMAVLCHHNGRMFAAVNRVYTDGAALVTSGSPTVTGIGTGWTAALAGRNFYVDGATQIYTIDSVDAAAQTLTLTANYGNTTDPFATYAIRPEDGQRRLIWFTQAGQPQSWNATYAIQLQEDGDEITGLMAKGSFLYIIEFRHIYRFTFQSDPAVDGFIYQSCQRGCINNRCWVQVEENTLMMDQDGCHAFSGGQDSQAISSSIQLLFQPLDKLNPHDFTINWNARDLFHAANYQNEEVVRWFVSMGGSFKPRHGLCYHYRTQRWWIEEYPVPVLSSSSAVIKFARIVFVGSEARQTFSMSQGYLDGLDPNSGSTYGTITAVDVCSMTDGAATFPSGLAGRTVSITNGRGKLQRRTIHSVDNGRLKVTQPWHIMPEVGDRYQIGGIHFRWESGQFDWTYGQMEIKRRIGFSFYPVDVPTTMFVRMYNDQDDSPILWAQSTMGSDYEGIGAQASFPELSVDMTDQSAYAQQRLEGRRDDNITGPRFITFDLTGVAASGGFVLSSIDLDGIDSDGGPGG